VAEIVVRWADSAGQLGEGGIGDLEHALDQAWCWVDVTAPDTETMQTVGNAFGLHALAVEDALHAQIRPKLDVYENGVFIAWLSPSRAKGDGIVATELDAFLGNKYLVTVHQEASAAVEAAAKDVREAVRVGSDWILHAIIDRAVDGTLPLVDEVGDELDRLEDTMLQEPRRSDLQALYQVRRQLVHLHRVVAPERDILRGLARERDLVSEEAYRYFQDVGDHLARVEDSIETYRDVGAGVMDIYLSAQSNRMNEIMKQLTVVATIFMPLTLLSGIYGMNVVKGMWPPVDAGWSFAVVVGSMAVIALWMSWYFRRRKWW
jgi:magnesium transporter